jgi:CHAD domain-containing protein
VEGGRSHATVLQPAVGLCIIIIMAIDLARLEKPLRKLRKSLKDWPAEPPVEMVHKLRTRIRRLEAMLDSFMLEQQPEMSRLLKAMKPVRRAAGDLRDVDVLVADALTLPNAGKNQSVVPLVEYLGSMRVKRTGKLRKTISHQRKRARRHLKQCIRLAVSGSSGKKTKNMGASPAVAVGVATNLSEELRQWPRLNRGNIHEFRKQVKRLRYILQMAESPAADTTWLNTLGKVKDQIGDWHDWCELQRIAQGVLDKKDDGPTLRQIAKIMNSRFEQAVATANKMRAHYLDGGAAGRRGRMNNSVINTAARLAA